MSLGMCLEMCVDVMLGMWLGMYQTRPDVYVAMWLRHVMGPVIGQVPWACAQNIRLDIRPRMRLDTSAGVCELAGVYVGEYVGVCTDALSRV